MKMADCPSPIALTLLRLCRNDSGYKAEFITKIWVKLLPARAQIDDKPDHVENDGFKQVDMIDRIKEMRNVSIEENPLKDDVVFENAFGNYSGEDE